MVDEDDIVDNTEWDSPGKPVFEPAVPLSLDQLKDFKDLMKKNMDLFALSIDDLGVCAVRAHKINLLNDEPIFLHPYRKSTSERLKIQKEIAKMLKAKVIRPSRSAWSAPVIMIPKKDGTERMCVDYRKLNAVTKQVNWPLPIIQDIFDRLSGSKWFSALDLKSGYWQIEMSPESIEKTAFSTPDGHYEFLRLPFGLKNAPAEFSRIMHQVLGNLKFVEIYLDDITIHSKTFDEHVSHIKIVFDKLREANLKINHEKCTWCAKSLRILGHVISEDTISMDEA